MEPETATIASSRYSEWKSLLGFYPEEDAINLVKSQGVPIDEERLQVLTGKIKAAIDYVKSLGSRKNEKPEIREIPPEYFLDRGKKLQAEPTFQEHLVGMKNWSFDLVEIGRVRAFQPNLNPEYVEQLVQRAPPTGDIAGLLRFCLPEKSEVSKSVAMGGFNPATNTLFLVSENSDLRIIGQIRGEDQNTGRSFMGFVYGTGLPQMSVVEYKGLFMLKNGYHRAYALYRKGHQFIPCLVVRTDSYNFTGGAAPGFFNLDLMQSDKSPMLSDFTGPAAVTYQRRLMRMVVSVHGEVQAFPV